jgi:hypothetical protein
VYKIKLIAVIAASLGAAAAANASLITFTASGTFDPVTVNRQQVTPTLSGTITIDTTAGTVVSLDLDVSTDPPDYNIINSQSSKPNNDYEVVVYHSSTNDQGVLDLFIYAPVPGDKNGSLVGYTGGALCNENDNCQVNNGANVTADHPNETEDPQLASGTLTQQNQSNPTPEPSTWMLALGAPAVLMLRRFVRL